MQKDSGIRPPLIAQGVVERALPGSAISGDRHLVIPIAGGILFAVLDGLGHGEEAAAAARIAQSILVRHSEEPLPILINRCHGSLLKSRGFVMTLATMRWLESELTWLGVGDIAGVLLRRGPANGSLHCLAARGGVVGYALPELRPSVLALAEGDSVILATDGIAAGFAENLPQNYAPQELADHILRRHFKGTDDALVLVARYLGHAHA